MKKIILIVGMPGSGKSFATDIIKRKFKAEVFHSGDVIREEIKKRGLKYTPENDTKIADWFHSKGRDRLIVLRTWNKIKKSKKKLVVIEGFRSFPEYIYLKNLSKSNPTIIAVLSPFSVRVKRELQRGRFGKEETVSYLKERDRNEKKRGLEKIMKKAKVKINNSKLSKKQMEKRIVELAKKI